MKTRDGYIFATKKELIRDLIAGISFANLSLLRVWSDLFIYDNPNNLFYRNYLPTKNSYIAIFINIFIVTFVFSLLIFIAKYYSNKLMSNILTIILFVIIGIALFSNRSLYLPFEISSLTSTSHGIIMVSVIVGLICLTIYHTLAMKVLITIGVILSPLFFFNFSHATWILFKGIKYAHDNHETKFSSTNLPLNKSFPNIILIVFDEMDFRLSFPERPNGLELTNFDKLAKTSFFASNAYPPAKNTDLSIPSLLTGEVVSKVELFYRNDYLITYKGWDKKIRLSNKNTLFQKMANYKLGSSVVGWVIPYCRLFKNKLNSCSTHEDNYEINSLENELLDNIPKQLFTLFPFFEKQNSINRYISVLSDAKKILANNVSNFMFIHLPVPHEHFIYNRKENNFTFLNGLKDGYISNLSLSDHALGELITVIKNANYFDKGIIIVTSDHHWRKSKQFDGKSDNRVPFIIKMPLQTKGVTYNNKFNTVLLSNLLIEIIKGDVSSYEDISNYLNQNSNEE